MRCKIGSTKNKGEQNQTNSHTDKLTLPNSGLSVLGKKCKVVGVTGLKMINYYNFKTAGYIGGFHLFKQDQILRET